MTNLHPITLTATLPAIERDLADRRAAAATAAALRPLAAAARAVRRGTAATLRTVAPRLAGAI